MVNYCVFTNDDVWEDTVRSDLESWLSRFIADVVTARAYVGGFGFGVAMLVAFLYIGLLQIPFLVAFLVWSCVLLVLVCLLALGYGLWVRAVDWDDAGTKEDVSAWDGIGGRAAPAAFDSMGAGGLPPSVAHVLRPRLSFFSLLGVLRRGSRERVAGVAMIEGSSGVSSRKHTALSRE